MPQLLEMGLCNILTVPNVKNVEDLTRLSITETWHGAARLTSNWTLHVSKPNKVNHTLILSNVLTVKATT